jgi:NAD(P)-dependent dehydrogenase (short-subunit alcohol dehydrogenase family)
VLVYNAFIHTRGGAAALPLAEFEQELRVNVTGALAAAQYAAAQMTGHGTIVLTGGGLAFAPSAQAASLSVGKAGLRALALTLHQELAPRGIHAGTVTIGGYVGRSPSLSPEAIAQAFWAFHQQPREAFEAEIVVR